jgi:hypothetical protein
MKATADLVQSLENSEDLAAWINSRLGEDTDDLTDLAEIDRRVGQLATSLEISYQDIANDVEQTLETTTRTITRATFELQFMRESTLHLQSTLQKGKQASTVTSNQSAANSVDQVLQRLRELDLIQRNMMAARHILQETESWKSLESEVTNYISSNDVQSFQKAATRLNEAGKSLPLFQDTPEHEPRKVLLTSLENQLEATLSTNLVAAASTNNIVLCRDYYQIFVQINRETDFRTYYNGARWAELVSMWNDAVIGDCGEGTPGEEAPTDDFATFFRRFLIAFESLVSEERNLQASIFPEPLESVTSFIQAIFENITPSLPQRLERLAANRGADALPPLIEAYRSSLQCVQSLTIVMEKLALYSSTFTEMTGEQAPPSTAKRRRSSRWVSFSRKSFSGMPPLGSKNLTWESALLEPFLDYQSNYGTLESDFMSQLLPSTDGPKRNKSFSVKEREFRELSVDVFSRADGSLQRCSTFTNGYGAAGLVEANQTFICKFIRAAEQQLSQNTTSTTAAPSPVAQLTDFDFTVQDWTKLHPCIRLLDAAKVIHERTRSLESKLFSFISLTHKEIQEGSTSQRMGLRAGEASRPDLQLLSQSTLNSIGLRDLFRSLDDGQKQSKIETRAQLVLLGQVEGTLRGFAGRVQATLSEIILAPLYSHFEAYESLNCWTAESKKADSELRTPSFSISPTQAVQRVAEALLKLPGIFEAYAEDDTLGFYIELLPFAAPENEERHDLIDGLDPDEITATWLSSLTVMLLDRFTGEILPRIRTLTAEGCKQLAADVDYLSNIVQAFNVEWRELGLWKEFVNMDPESARSFTAPDERADKIFRRVCGMRGWGSAVGPS